MCLKNFNLFSVCGSSFGPGGGGAGIPPGLSSGVFFVDEAPCGGCRSIPSQAREYVESLHQNQKDSLLYGKIYTLNHEKISLGTIITNLQTQHHRKSNNTCDAK